jgi:hypothetical protein
MEESRRRAWINFCGSYRLRKNPLHFGEPVAEGLRRIISEPLAIYFSIAGNQITVEAVGWAD